MRKLCRQNPNSLLKWSTIRMITAQCVCIYDAFFLFLLYAIEVYTNDERGNHGEVVLTHL